MKINIIILSVIFVLALVGAVISRANKGPEVYYGKTYRVKSGFYKGCTGKADEANSREVELYPLRCNGEWVGGTWTDIKNVELTESP